MLKTRIEVMRSIADPLLRSEKLIDAAIAELTSVMTAGIAGRDKAKLPLEAGEVALDAVNSAIRQLLDGRRSVHLAHRDFRDVKDLMGLKNIAASEDPGYGDKGDTPREYWGAGENPAVAVLRAA